MNRIRRAIESIELPSDLHNRSKLGVQQAKLRKRRSKKIIIVPVIASLFLVFSVGVAAATSTSMNELVAKVSPEIALLLQPVELSSTDEGINMEVVAAMNDDDTAVVYVTMQDLKGERIDETLDIYDYFISGGHSFTSEVVAFDEITKTATVRFLASGGEKISNKKLKFQIRSFLSDKQVFEQTKVNIDLKSVEDKKPIDLHRDFISGMGGKVYSNVKDRESIKILPDDHLNIKIPAIDFMEVTNVGFIKNKLHIQTKWLHNDKDNHGSFYFMNTAGDKIYPSSISFGRDKSGKLEYGNNFQEYVFDVDTINLESYELSGDFTTSGNFVSGNWQTIFKLSDVNESKIVDFLYNFGNWQSQEVTISPLGLTIIGLGEVKNSTEITATISMKNGSTQKLTHLISITDKGQIKLKLLPNEPLDVEEVKSISINGIDLDI
ncbi:DUF4179 domain-containing protein [Bacillus sp. FJAT-22090]|uniref:DUF4179 domain-containing protein n=1 Tax=Bacillus sp. FJAT-22090 TaxID=1581038 RepID=UPI00119D8817|nr:DUF4179 domain-containing protein [Bacillus sp. FJAT-22090]